MFSLFGSLFYLCILLGILVQMYCVLFGFQLNYVLSPLWILLVNLKFKTRIYYVVLCLKT